MSTTIDLNGVTMNVVKTAANGVVNAETIFKFSQQGEIVTASYSGGGIAQGRFVGVLNGDKLEFRYAQVETGGKLDGGRSVCEIGLTEDGRLRMIEHFEWESRSGQGVNIFEEII